MSPGNTLLSENPPATGQSKTPAISGLLIVALTGVVFDAFMSLLSFPTLIRELFMDFDSIVWRDPYRIFSSTLEFARALLLLALAVPVIVFTFARHRAARALSMAYYVVYGISALVLSQYFSYGEGGSLFGWFDDTTAWIRATGKTVLLVLAIAVPAVWIPYFLFSKRVRSTFIRLRFARRVSSSQT